MALVTLQTQMDNIKPEADQFTLMEKLDITITEAMILKLIWASGNHGTNLAHIGRSARQHVYNMRPKLLKHNITLVNLGGKSYGMPKASRDALDAMFNCGQLAP